MKIAKRNCFNKNIIKKWIIFPLNSCISDAQKLTIIGSFNSQITKINSGINIKINAIHNLSTNNICKHAD